MADRYRLSFHEGGEFRRIAGTYDTLVKTIVEAVQNAIDADAQRIFIGADLQQRQVVVADNGSGVDKQKFSGALQSVGQTVKTAGKLGRFGIGLVSPLDKCRQFVVVSQPANSQEVNEWVFVGEEIFATARDVHIPYRSPRSMPKIPKQFARFSGATASPDDPWRTMVVLSEVTDDAVVGIVKLDDLEPIIRHQLGPEMLKRRNQGREVVIEAVVFDAHGKLSRREFRALDYTGEPLEVVEIFEEHCGTVRFELYRALKKNGKRAGAVTVKQTNDNTSIGWSGYRGQALGARWLDKGGPIAEAFSALDSGYFEGRIQIEKVELAPCRTKFKLSQAVKASFIAVYRWYQDYGRHYLDIEREALRDDLNKRLGEESLDRLHQLLENDDVFAPIRDKLLEVVPGADGKLKKPTVRERKPADPSKSSKPPVVAERPKVKRDKQKPPQTGALSFKFEYDSLPIPSIWEFDRDRATITLNTSHPLWLKVGETNGKVEKRHEVQIMHLQEWIALKIIMLLAKYPPEEFEEAARAEIDREIGLYTAAFILKKEKVK